MERRIGRRARFAVVRGSLALCVLGFAFAGQAARAQAGAPAAPAVSDPAKLEEARRHFQRALALLRDPEGELVEAAYLEFKAAYELSRSPRVLGNIGYCAMKMERNSESVTAYREYIRFVPDIDPKERAQIDQDLVTMTDGAATITVRYAGTTGWTLVDERIPVRATMVTNTYAGTMGESVTLLLHPGHHVLRVKAEGEEQSHWEIDATGGASFSHIFPPKPAAPPLVAVAARPQGEGEKPVSHAAPIATMATGGVVLLGAAAFGFAAYLKMKDLENNCPNNLCPNASFHSDVNTGATFGTVTDTLLIAGGVLVIAGGVWLGLTSGHKDADSSAPTVSGACVPGACGMSLRASF